MRFPASMAWICPLCTRIESPLETGNLCTQVSSVLWARAFSNWSGVTPRLRPTIRWAPGVVSAMYQFSVFGSPPRAAATAMGGWTWRLRRSRQSSHLMRMGKGREEGHFGPMIRAVFFSRSWRSDCPSKLPCVATDWASGRSTISQLSPIGRAEGRVRPREEASPWPPQTRS